MIGGLWICYLGGFAQGRRSYEGWGFAPGASQGATTIWNIHFWNRARLTSTIGPCDLRFEGLAVRKTHAILVHNAW
jgi:hypothetical protein